MGRLWDDRKAWARVVGVGLFARIPCKIAAFFVVPFLDEKARKEHSVFGNNWTNDLSYYNIAVRNGAYNLSRKPMPNFSTQANTKDHTLEKEEGLQWRYRRSTGDGKYVSFRMSWGKPRKSKGKREIYIGWKMRENFEDNTMSLTFMQIRIF